MLIGVIVQEMSINQYFLAPFFVLCCKNVFIPSVYTTQLLQDNEMVSSSSSSGEHLRNKSLDQEP